MKKCTAMENGREVGERAGALLIHRYAVPLLQQEKAKVRRREVGGKEGVLLIHRYAVPLLQQEKAKGALTEGGRERSVAGRRGRRPLQGGEPVQVR